MPSKIYLIANWKMQLNLNETKELAEYLKNWQTDNLFNKSELILAPSFTALQTVSDIIKSTPISLAAQDVFYHLRGAYTGEISVTQLKELGVKYVILGHSERRQFQKEDDDDINRKIKIVLEHGLVPVVCIGETIDERRMGKTDVTIIRQLIRGFEDIELKGQNKIIIAYEPVWAISPAPPAQPEDAQHASQIVKRILLEFFTQEVVENNFIVIYGGSVDSANVLDFVDQKLIKGVLIGGASLKNNELTNIVKKIEAS